MTKLMEWLFYGFLFIGLWLAVILGNLHSSLDEKVEYMVLWLPVLFLLLFGIYAIIVVLYRVFTFNNCDSAAAELQQQIKEAIHDLESKGIKLKKAT